MSGLLAMGGYGAYIWPAYGITLLLIGGLVAFTLRGHAKARARLAALEKP